MVFSISYFGVYRGFDQCNQTVYTIVHEVTRVNFYPFGPLHGSL